MKHIVPGGSISTIKDEHGNEIHNAYNHEEKKSLDCYSWDAAAFYLSLIHTRLHGGKLHTPETKGEVS
jgi:hypothetical protein